MTAAGIAAALLPAAATSATTTTPTPTVQWGPCSGSSDPAVHCATLTVPIDWADPDGATTDIAIAKRDATKASKGSLVIDPGGPGGSGVTEALDPTGFLSPDLLEHFDIIGFDPRGVGDSDPVTCPPADVPETFAPVPTTQAQYDALVDTSRTLARDCRASTGPLADHVDSVSVAHDIDAIRIALGQDTISYYGVSYGTLMGSAYAELFPTHLRAIVLDGTMDHSRDVHSFFVSEAAAVEDSFAQFVDWCGLDSTCALHGRDIYALWDKLMGQADAGTLMDGTTPISPVELTNFAAGYLYAADLTPPWSMLADKLKDLAGGTDQAASPRILDAPAPRWGDSDSPYNFQAIICNDYDLHEPNFAALQADLQLARHVAPHLRLSALAWDAVSTCLGWPTAPTNPQHDLKVVGAPPVLIVNSRHDPATPYEWALSNAEQLGTAGRLLTYEGSGHSAFLRNDCTRTTVESYLDDPSKPVGNTTCAATLPAG
ncbi:MAG TPA: alpha/beta hydrolase [Mycobacteriales bacterium]|nr:alpha/beta hydrolase [Mycobacteriales bacterium]